MPETKMIDDLLHDLQANKIHITIVVDGLGSISGIMAMENIIEETVGEIHDEYDSKKHACIVINDHTWVLEAEAQLTDFYKITRVNEDDFEKMDDDADTLAGLLLEVRGEFPALHEEVFYYHHELEVLVMDSRCILKVKFTINEPSTTEVVS